MKMKLCIVEILLLLILVAAIEPVEAVPANPTPFTFIQPDKSSFQAIQVGDERGAHFEAMDGYTIIKDENNWWNYAGKDANGKLASIGQRVGLSDPKILGLKTHLHPTVKVTELLIGDEQIPDTGSFVPSKISKPEQAPQTGTKKVLVILINFTDVPQDSGSTSPYYQNLLFNASTGANSMNNYFKEVSYNKINITGDVAGNRWFRASNNLASYGADISDIDTNFSQPDPNNYYIFKLAKEAVIAADPYVDYTQYDTNSDGIIDNLIIVHSGNGQESSGLSTDIWSHKWSIYVYSGGWNLGYMTNDGVRAVGYTMLAENSPLGTFAHEFGHDLGLPDLYDTDSSNGASEGIGEWGLMGSGNWLGSPPGSYPAHLSAWSKYFLGWVNPIKVNSTLLNKQINQVETNDEVYMILDNPGDTPGYLDWSTSGTGIGEYFLVENRRKTGYDAYLPGEGLLIWHIDESRGNNTDETHRLVDLEEADGLNDFDNEINRGDANDPWYNKIIGFTESTTPNSKFYNGSTSGVRVSNISASASIMTANLIVGWPPPIISFVSPTPVNNSNLLQNWVYVSITSDETLNIALLEWNGTNETMQGSGTTWYKNKTNLAEGVYTYRVWANDSSGNLNVSETRYVNIDLPPSIAFVSPTPVNNSIHNRNWIYVNITSDQTLNSALLEWNGVNETMLGSGINWYKNKTGLSDGDHTYRVWGNDSTNNWNVTEIKRVMLDTSPTIVTANPTGYQSGYSAAKNGTSIMLNASISDILAGVNNATVNASQINRSLGIVILNNISGFYTNSTVIVNTSDGTYRLNITTYDNASNKNDTVQIPVIVDNTPPSNITINPVTYQRGIAANNRSIIGFSASAADPLINGVSSGIRNASLNASVFNTTGWIALTNNSGIWMGNVTFDRSAVETGNYSINFSFSDNASNINNSMQVNISIDNTPPLVNNLSISSGYINMTDSVNITANITSSDNVSQVNPSELFARVAYPNGTSIDYPLSGGSGSLFYKNFTDTAQYGRYNVTILANDTTGNTNSTQRTQFVTTYMTNLVVVTDANTETLTVAPYSNTTLRLFTNNSSNGTINISRSKVNLTSNALGVTNPGIYVLVNANASIINNLSYVIISVNYTDAEVSSYVESSLRLYRWNITSSGWDKLSGAGSYPYVNDAGVDTENNFVWANLTTLSEFAVTGDVYVPPTLQSSSSSGGGGGGGGGGGTSGENYSNIESKEKRDIHIFKDKVSSYKFNTTDPIMYVNITGNINAGEVTTMVEVLRNTSSIVKNNSAPGIVYKNLNIWVGTSGFAIPKNIQKGVISFRVQNSWLKSSGVTGNDVRMVRWNGITWLEIETTKRTESSEYTYYEAYTDSFSPFAITAFRSTAPQVEAIKTPIITETQAPEETKIMAKETPETNGGLVVMTVVLVIIVAILAVLYMRGKKKI